MKHAHAYARRLDGHPNRFAPYAIAYTHSFNAPGAAIEAIATTMESVNMAAPCLAWKWKA